MCSLVLSNFTCRRFFFYPIHVESSPEFDCRSQRPFHWVYRSSEIFCSKMLFQKRLHIHLVHLLHWNVVQTAAGCQRIRPNVWVAHIFRVQIQNLSGKCRSCWYDWGSATNAALNVILDLQSCVWFDGSRYSRIDVFQLFQQPFVFSTDNFLVS